MGKKDEAEVLDADAMPDKEDAGAAPDEDPALAAAHLRIEDLEAQVADLSERVARARADYQNLQRRVERDADLERQRAKARALESFLQVFEYGQMAAQEAERHPGPLAEGVKMVVREFERLLETEGVQQFGAIGEAFDPAGHEAIAEEEGDVAPGRVSRVVRPGYRLGERVLRYAKVAVQPEEE